MEGRFPDTAGGLWLPRTAGAGDSDGLRDGAALEDADALDEGAVVDDGGGDGDAICATVGDAVSDIADRVGLASLAGGLSATPPVDEAASAAAARATSPAIATIGTTATRLPSGRSSRQFGQKPETGVVT